MSTRVWRGHWFASPGLIGAESDALARQKMSGGANQSQRHRSVCKGGRFSRKLTGPNFSYDSLPGKRKPAVVPVITTIVVVTAIALETLVIASQEAITVGLLILIVVAVTAVAPVVAMSVSVKV